MTWAVRPCRSGFDGGNLRTLSRNGEALLINDIADDLRGEERYKRAAHEEVRDQEHDMMLKVRSRLSLGTMSEAPSAICGLCTDR